MEKTEQLSCTKAIMRCNRIVRNHFKIALISVTLLVALVYVKTYHDAANNAHEQPHPQHELLEKQLRQFEARVDPNLGALGIASYVADADKAAAEKSLKRYAINKILSDRIPLNRTLKDYRNKACASLSYSPTLTASVVIVFHNELFSVLLRTVWSVLLRSPKNLLHEVVLVDDANADAHLIRLLDHYITTRLKPYNVQMLHLNRRQGLIRARIHGARRASGDVLVFLDAHCEATVGWLEPLLARIQEDRTVVPLPVIDVIMSKTLHYSTFGGDSAILVGGFSWSGYHIWIDVQDESQRGGKVAPVKSPTMQGGLFAVERRYFWEMGAYDDRMEGWGGENLEMSFRIWQCGGRIEAIPCSRVGHIYRAFHPYEIPGIAESHAINTARLAHVWMDDYKRLYFRQAPKYENDPIIGDLTERKRLRRELKCKSFKWYLENVYPEKLVQDENVQAYGRVRLKSNLCLDNFQVPSDRPGVLGLYTCHPYETISQYFSLMLNGKLRNEEHCAEGLSNATVLLSKCRDGTHEQYWTYRPLDGTIENAHLKLCLSGRGARSGQAVRLEACRGGEFQRWSFGYVNKTAFEV